MFRAGWRNIWGVGTYHRACKVYVVVIFVQSFISGLIVFLQAFLEPANLSSAPHVAHACRGHFQRAQERILDSARNETL